MRLGRSPGADVDEYAEWEEGEEDDVKGGVSNISRARAQILLVHPL